MLSVKISEVKQEYQLQEWSGMLRQWKESGLSVKDWCVEQGILSTVITIGCAGSGRWLAMRWRLIVAKNYFSLSTIAKRP